jgi:hypothetical protein
MNTSATNKAVSRGRKRGSLHASWSINRYSVKSKYIALS